MAALPVPLRAAGAMILCCAFVALSTFLAKALGKGVEGTPMHPFMVVVGRYGVAALTLALLVWARRTPLRGAPLLLYAGRSGCGWMSVTALFAASAMIPLADATALSFLSPVFSLVLAILFLGEKVGPVRWGAAAIALSGGALLVRPGFQAVEPGALVALFAAVTMAAELVFAKLLARREGVLRMLFYTNLFGAVFALIAGSFVWRAPTGTELILMAFVAWTMVAGQALYMIALKIADASFVTPFFYGTLLFAALYDWAWFGTVPAPLSFAGAGLIVGGAALLAFRDAKRRDAAAE